ncbi:MAG: class I SAM-dependent methyltransferase [Gammaproteobacteria bacterium]|nr:class I SAM-dependent methyltransferase [Gammaproteobacteria bacterium]MBU1443527.1 class I SAM-dependent methyltransferase [Gammaproteobacteria bacterium]MBU2286907.1 class I SAM-dependent methyltransferase [Gammaproteobacteria bacterium]MBU2409937.1 class I SAM-dependent methyltransferase [Gammaproteobacteria bacterium]
MNSFSDSKQVSNYAENAARMVPGMRDLPKMAGALLKECVTADARIIVLGAGGGQELRGLAESYTGWSFDGIDPSAEMLQLARTTLGHFASRVQLHQGYIDTAPMGPFDGATCMLTLHFLPKAERLATLQQLHKRLKTGAPLVVVHHSIPNQGTEREKWLKRSAGFAIASGMEASLASRNIPALEERLPILTPDEDVELLKKAGFDRVELFYCAFTFKGWVAYKK